MSVINLRSTASEWYLLPDSFLVWQRLIGLEDKGLSSSKGLYPDTNGAIFEPYERHRFNLHSLKYRVYSGRVRYYATRYSYS